jgi:hypothetical protein
MKKVESYSMENKSGTYKRCGAKARSNSNNPCRKAPLRGKERCLNHGGRSTGARTIEGKLRSSSVHLKHGLYTKEACKEREAMRVMMNWHKDIA